jgi:hypothetical protein
MLSGARRAKLPRRVAGLYAVVRSRRAGGLASLWPPVLAALRATCCHPWRVGYLSAQVGRRRPAQRTVPPDAERSEVSVGTVITSLDHLNSCSDQRSEVSVGTVITSLDHLNSCSDRSADAYCAPLGPAGFAVRLCVSVCTARHWAFSFPTSYFSCSPYPYRPRPYGRCSSCFHPGGVQCE